MLRTMFSRETTGLIALFCKVYELRDDPAGRRNLALEIQEDLLRRAARGNAWRSLPCMTKLWFSDGTHFRNFNNMHPWQPFDMGTLNARFGSA
jgi:hypothetical protein